MVLGKLPVPRHPTNLDYSKYEGYNIIRPVFKATNKNLTLSYKRSFYFWNWLKHSKKSSSILIIKGIYSRMTVALILMAYIPWLFRTRS